MRAFQVLACCLVAAAFAMPVSSAPVPGPAQPGPDQADPAIHPTPGNATAEQVKTTPSQQPIPPADGYIVGFRDLPQNVSEDANGKAAPGQTFHGAAIVRLLDQLKAMHVRPDNKTDFLKKAQKDPQVAYIEPNNFSRFDGFSVNDPYYFVDYETHETRLESAWSTSTGSHSAAVCIVDTGARTTHEDLSGNYLGGYDVVDSDSTPDDTVGHGTHVAGIAVGLVNNNKGLAGAAPSVGFYAYRASSSSTISDVNAAAGIKWCADNTITNTVISMSFGSSSLSTTEKNALDYAYGKGKLLVAAAGNAGGAVDYPGAYSKVIAVSCTDASNNLACTSNTGPQVAVAAPGDSIWSTCYSGDGDYCQKTGTSMSTPLVAGAAALKWSLSPSLTLSQLTDDLKFSARDIGASGFDNSFGYGLLDGYCLIKDIHPCDPPGNDFFSHATTASGLTSSFAQGTYKSASEANEPSPCGSVDSTVWYQLNAAYSGSLRVSTAGSGYDTVVAAYTGSDVSSLSNKACNDDYAGTTQSQIDFQVSQGQTYYVQVGGFGGATGTLSVAFTLFPDQADCLVSGDAGNARTSARFVTPPKNCQGILFAGVDTQDWYGFTAALGRTIQVTMTPSSGTNFDLCLYNSAGTTLACSSNGGSSTETVSQLVTSAGTYYVRVSQVSGSGTYGLNLHTCINLVAICVDVPSVK